MITSMGGAARSAIGAIARQQPFGAFSASRSTPFQGVGRFTLPRSSSDAPPFAPFGARKFHIGFEPGFYGGKGNGRSLIRLSANEAGAISKLFPIPDQIQIKAAMTESGEVWDQFGRNIQAMVEDADLDPKQHGLQRLESEPRVQIAGHSIGPALPMLDCWLGELTERQLLAVAVVISKYRQPGLHGGFMTAADAMNLMKTEDSDCLDMGKDILRALINDSRQTNPEACKRFEEQLDAVTRPADLRRVALANMGPDENGMASVREVAKPADERVPR